MLILTRKPGESVVIGKDAGVKIVVLNVNSNQVKLGFEADPSIVVNREEIHKRIQRERYLTQEEQADD